VTLIQQAMEQSKRPEIQSEANWRWGIITGRFQFAVAAGSETRPVEGLRRGPEEC